MINEIRDQSCSDHCNRFGQYFNSLKDVISKIPSKEKGNSKIQMRVAQSDDWRAFKNVSNSKKVKKIHFRDGEGDEFVNER